MVPPRKLSAVRLSPNPAIGENPERCGYEVNPTNAHPGGRFGIRQLMAQAQLRRAMVEFCCQRYFMALVLPWITSGCNQDKLSSDFTLFLNFGYPASFAFQPVGMLV